MGQNSVFSLNEPILFLLMAILGGFLKLFLVLEVIFVVLWFVPLSAERGGLLSLHGRVSLDFSDSKSSVLRTLYLY